VKFDRLVFHTAVLAALDSVFCSGTRRQINIILYGVPRASDGRNQHRMLLRGFRLAIHPCKGILQARLRPHYREIFPVVVGRIRAWSGREGRFFGQSEGLQGFGGCRFFFVKMACNRFCSKNNQKTAFFTTSCVSERFSTIPNTTEPDRSRAEIDLQPCAEMVQFGAVTISRRSSRCPSRCNAGYGVDLWNRRIPFLPGQLHIHWELRSWI
jgi:hypothetical protein